MHDQRIKTTTKVCKICGDSFHPFRASRGIYCSNKCKFADKISPVTLTCAGCGITFQKRTHKDGKYCTNACYQNAKKDRSPMERLRPFINKTDSCWIWTGGLNSQGYGRIFFQGRFWLVHRLMFTTVTGEDITNLVVRHYVCDNPPCCNPAHLRKGTKADNSKDMVDHHRHSHGETPYAKLTEQEAIAILNDPRKHAEIAKDFNVARRTVGHIKTGSTWKHLSR